MPLPTCVARCGHAGRQAVDVDEAVGGLLVEGIAGIIGGELVVVQRGVGTTAGHDGATAVQDHANLTGHVLLGVLDERVERLSRGENHCAS